ncbi:MAG TPA: TolC family protein, partial [Verrucomicrobiae bacterium]
MKKLTLFSLLLVFVFTVSADETNAPAWLSRPLSQADCINIALAQNAAILKAQSDLKASQGVVIQTRAVALPTLQASSQIKHSEPQAIESFPNSTPPNNNWNSGIQIVQGIYEGGKLMAAIQAASATKKQAIAQYNTQVADTLL